MLEHHRKGFSLNLALLVGRKAEGALHVFVRGRVLCGGQEMIFPKPHFLWSEDFSLKSLGVAVKIAPWGKFQP